MSERSDSKARALKEHGTFNRRADAVRDPLFGHASFFDPRDIVQVKYEMLRCVLQDNASVTEAAQRFGFSRVALYQALAALNRDGLFGLVPKRPGPRSAHKLDAAIVDYIAEQRGAKPRPSWMSLADEIAKCFGVVVHPRSVARAWERRKKKRRQNE